MPTINYGMTFEKCAQRVLDTVRPDIGDEFIVVFDGVASEPPAWLAKSNVTLLSTGRRSGPAVARNLAAKSAGGNILLFIDADVEIAPDVVERVRERFDADSEIWGLFGAYDDEPPAPGTVSRFRNLLHHHTHLRHAGPAESFWTGCGAMRKDMFFNLGGFDIRYALPSIEDIDLGVRAVDAGGRIELDPGILCKHHKCWTLGSMIKTDIFQRAIPWTRLMISAGKFSTRLNLDHRARLSGGCAVLALALSLLSTFNLWAILPASGCTTVLYLLNRDFYKLCHSRGGIFFSSSAFFLHWLYFTYSTVTFAIVMVIEGGLLRE